MRTNYFAPQNYHRFINTCNQLFQKHELGVFLFFPKTDAATRISQYIQDYSSDKNSFKIELNLQILDKLPDIEEFIAEQVGSRKKTANIFVTNMETLIHDNNFALINKFVEFTRTQKEWRFIFQFDFDITHPHIVRHLKDMHLFTNLHYQSLYPYADVLVFIDYLCDKWEITLDQKTKEAVYRECGGHLWLVKELVRSLWIYKDMSFDECLKTEAMFFKLEQIYLSLQDSEREVLRKISRNERPSENPIESHSLNYLKKIGLIQKNEITIGLLAYYIRKTLPKVKFELKDKHVIINNVVVDRMFSRSELKVLRVLLLLPGTIISRDQVANVLWPVNTEENYSEWAIDRIIARLRDKIATMGFDKNIVKTLRGQGYSIQFD